MRRTGKSQCNVPAGDLKHRTKLFDPSYDAKQTLFALNHWQAGSGADLGIGNQPENNPDWTFASNAGSYTAKRLRVLVRCK